ncbi:GntR family transcriptional regulator [Paenibacillus solisilvae]|uniref:GntR family transcriptional regulator n=1 Tax=Paenibacillus solisilvae TaxID=2486751 RepID=A0ABW0VNZ3_9BACL
MDKSVKRVPLYKQIEQYLLDQIRLNNWQPNHKLPSETELAEKFNVSRLTIKKAMQNLMEEGLLYRIQGKGTFLSSNLSGEPIAYSMDYSDSDKQSVAFITPLAKTIRSLHLINGIEEELSKRGYHMIFCKTFNSKQLEKQMIQEVIRKGVSGIIIYPVEGETYNEKILELTINQFPLVIVDRYLQGLDTNYVCADNVQGAYDATNHLIERGHTKIGIISTHSQGTSSIKDRLTGYEKALAEHNIPIEHRLRILHFHVDQVNQIIYNGIISEYIKEELRLFLRQNPDMTAVFAVNSAIGLSVMETAIEIGLRIPEDLSVIFFDDYEYSGYSKIPPTYVNQHEYEIGTESAKLIISVIENPDQERQKVIIPTELVVRKSTANHF